MGIGQAVPVRAAGRGAVWGVGAQQPLAHLLRERLFDSCCARRLGRRGIGRGGYGGGTAGARHRRARTRGAAGRGHGVGARLARALPS
ncbi:hypothetical protein EYB53_007245, partial [Candidatus Chloroploca sp. M-50]